MKKELRIWDNDILNKVYVTSIQIEAQIEQLVSELSKEDITELPYSMVPTETLYEIVMSIDLMYNMLLDRDLIKSGNKKQDSSKTH
jgi:hypothetical protein